MIPTLISAFSVMLASLVGTISVWKKMGVLIERNLHYLVSFSAGVFVLIAYELSHEAIEISPSLWTGVMWIVIGAIISLTIFKLLPDFHHHHDDILHDHTHNNIDARRVVISDSVHNFGDGVLLAAAFSVSITVGITTTISVFIHEIIQEISEFFVLKQGGFDTKKALLINFIASSTILLGALVGFFLLEKFEVLEGPILGLTAGAFIVIVLHDLIPHSINSIIRNSHIIKHILWFILGALLISIAGAAIPHIH